MKIKNFAQNTFFYSALVAFGAMGLSGCGGSSDDAAVVYPDIDTWTLLSDDAAEGLNIVSGSDGNDVNPVVFNNKLYVAFTEEDDSSNYTITVVVYSGDDNNPTWTTVSTSALTYSSSNSTSPSLAVANNKLYIGWVSEESSDVVRVAVYGGDDSSPSWTRVDGSNSQGLNINSGESAYGLVLFEHEDDLVAAWGESTASNGDHVMAKVFNGDDSSPSWTRIDGGTSDYGGIIASGNRGESMSNLFVCSYDSLPVFFWTESTDDSLVVRGAQYNGDSSSPSFTALTPTAGLTKDTDNDTSDPVCVSSGDDLYLTFEQRTSGETLTRFLKFGGDVSSPSWEYLDGDSSNSGIGLQGGTDANDVTDARMIDFGGTMYVAVEEENSEGDETDHIHVFKYDSNDEELEVTGNTTATSGLNQDNGYEAFDPIVVEFNTKIYLFMEQERESDGDESIHVLVGTGSE